VRCSGGSPYSAGAIIMSEQIVSGIQGGPTTGSDPYASVPDDAETDDDSV
jgi:hypothetical protein